MALTRLPVEALRTPLDSERLYIVRDAEALEALARIDREIDFSAHTVLAFRIETPNGICRLTSALARTDGGYLYRVRVSMFETDVIGDEPLFVLAPRIGGARGGSFRIRSGVLTRLRFSRQPQQAGPSVLPAAFHRSKIMRTFAAGLSLLSWIETEMKSGCGTGSTAR